MCVCMYVCVCMYLCYDLAYVNKSLMFGTQSELFDPLLPFLSMCFSLKTQSVNDIII
jgi:hypothetical protein